MPNIKSSAKRDALAKATNVANKSKRSILRTTVKKFDTAVSEGNKDMAVTAYKDAIKTIDQAAGKGLIHLNNAARKKSRLTVTLNTMAE